MCRPLSFSINCWRFSERAVRRNRLALSELRVELHIQRRPEPSPDWVRMWQEWLLVDKDDDPDAEDRGRQESPEVRSDDVTTA